jgi:hypothetical protein
MVSLEDISYNLLPHHNEPNFFHGSTATSLSSRLHYRGITITLRSIPQVSSGRVISPSKKPLPDNVKHTQEKDIREQVGFEPLLQQASGRKSTPETG